jgi:hypothetical protein
LNYTDPSFTSYIVHRATGYIVATNTGQSVYPYVTATSSTNDIIKTSYTQLKTLSSNGLVVDAIAYTDSAGLTYTMNIYGQTISDETTTLIIDVVVVELTNAFFDSPAPSSVPTLRPDDDRSSTVSGSGDDEDVSATKASTIAAAVLVSLALVLSVVFGFLMFSRR